MVSTMSDPEQGRAVSRPSWGRRLVGIEGLRGLAALSVVFGHVQIHLAREVSLGRASAVTSQLHHGLTLFFALSGFLLFRPFAAAVLRGGRPPGTVRFLTNRALRIYPAYLVILLASSYLLRTTYTVAADDSSGIAGVRGTLGPITEPGKILLDLTLFHSLVPYSLKTGLGASWSLTTEVCFYLVLPLLAGLAALAARKGLNPLLAVSIVPGTLLVVGLAGRFLAAKTLRCTDSASCFGQQWGANWHSVLERSLLAQADLFAYGAAAAVLFVLAERGTLRGTGVQLLRWAATAVFLGACAVLVVNGNLPGPLARVRWENSAVAAVCACLILATVLPGTGHRPSVVGRLAELAPFRLSGLISYSFYLWHLPVLWWLEVHGVALGPTRWGFLGNLVMVFAITGVLSALTYRFVEAPALRLKKRTDTGRGAATEPVAELAAVEGPARLVDGTPSGR